RARHREAVSAEFVRAVRVPRSAQSALLGARGSCGLAVSSLSSVAPRGGARDARRFLRESLVPRLLFAPRPRVPPSSRLRQLRRAARNGGANRAAGAGGITGAERGRARSPGRCTAGTGRRRARG